jgi:hypothetical protein
MPQNRDFAGKFIKGVSGNPGGRPKSLSHYIRENTKDGKDLADRLLNVIKTGEYQGEKVAFDDVLKIIRELFDRGFGKPSQSVDVNATGEMRIAFINYPADPPDKPEISDD